MALKDAWTNPKLAELYDKLVYLKVLNNSFVIRKATTEEAALFWNRREPKRIFLLEKDIKEKELIDIDNKGKSFVKIIGGKAANFFELASLETIPLPENSFAIPGFSI